MTSDQPVTILICALGGEGGGVLADWLVDTARHCGHSVQGTSIPGVAQRTGATTYYVEIFPRPDSALAGRKPVFGLYAVPGALDLMVGSELLEAARQAAAGMVSPDRTAVVVSTSRILTTAEKMQQADGRMAEDALLAVLRDTARELEVFDMAALARNSGTVISAVLFGALAGWCQASGLLPFGREAYEAAIRRGGKGVEASLRGFGAAFERVAGARAQRAALLWLASEVAQQAEAAAPQQTAPALLPETGTLPALLPEIGALPAPVASIAALGHARLLDYQDSAYAQLYLQRLSRVVQAELASGVAAAQGWAASTETARWLALWMAFDDIVRVADLKSRAGRFERVRTEAKAGAGELLRIHDLFKPGVPEFAALLPRRLADALLRWDARRVARGKEPFALPLAIASHSVTGLVALRLLASLKRLRRYGSRFATEQQLIERWLAAVEAGARAHGPLGAEIACCGRLIKGYGSTNERGKHNLLHVIAHLATAPAAAGASQFTPTAAGASQSTPALASAAERARAIAEARQAALADEAGQRLDQTLIAHGAPPRPLAAQPIRWHRRRPDTPAPGVARPS